MAPGMRFAFRFASVTGYGLALSESRGQTQGMRVSSGEGVCAMRCKRSKEVAPLESFGRDCYQTAWDGKATSRPPLKIEAVAFELLQWVVNHTSRSSPAQCSSSRQGPVAPTAPPVGRGGGGCLRCFTPHRRRAAAAFWPAGHSSCPPLAGGDVGKSSNLSH